MNALQKTPEQKMNRLLINNGLSEDLFLYATGRAEMPELAQWFSRAAVLRTVFHEQIKRCIPQAPLENMGTGLSHNPISALELDREVLDVEGDAALFEVTIACERHSLKNYDRILGEKGIPVQLRGILDDQRDQIARGLSILDHLDALLDGIDDEAGE